MPAFVERESEAQAPKFEIKEWRMRELSRTGRRDDKITRSKEWNVRAETRFLRLSWCWCRQSAPSLGPAGTANHDFFAPLRTLKEVSATFVARRRPSSHSHAMPQVPQDASTPNPSFEVRPNGKPPGPGRWYAVHFHRPGPGVLPLVPPQLER